MNKKNRNIQKKIAQMITAGKPAPVAVETNQCRQVKGWHVRGRPGPTEPVVLGMVPAQPVKTPEAPKTQKKSPAQK